MDTEIGIGISSRLDAVLAGKEAARLALSRIGRLQPKAAIVFISTIFNQSKTLKAISSVIDDTPIVGCSSIASITSSGVHRDSVTVCIIASNSIEASCGIGRNISKNSRLAGSQAAQQSTKVGNTGKQIFLLFSDGLSGNSADILRGAQEIRGTGFPIIGGNSTDGMGFGNTYQYMDDNVYSDCAIGLLIGGDINVNVGKAHGWHPIGRPHSITRASSNLIKEIDKKRAVELYEEYLNKTTDILMAEGIARWGSVYPLGVLDENQNDYIARVPLKIDQIGCLLLNAEIYEGNDVNLMIGDKRLLLDAVKKACRDALKGVKKTNIKFIIVFSSIGRFGILRNELDEEINIVKEMVGKNVPVFGCYTHGEYAPINSEEHGGEFAFHNQTISVTIVSE